MKNQQGVFKTRFYFIIYLITSCQFNTVFGQLEVQEEQQRLYYEMLGRVKKFKDMKDFRDVFHYNRFLLGKNRISGNISYNTGRVVIEDAEHRVHNEVRSAIGFYSRIRFFEQYSFNSTFYKDFNPRAAARWTSNYTYSLGRYTWKPNRFNYGYENYLNNRYSDNLEEMGRKFMEGYYFISYSHNLGRLTNKVRLDSTSNLKFTYFARYAIKYRDNNEVIRGGLDSGKPIIGAGLRMTLFWNIYAESAVYYYGPAEWKKQQPWDPDYSYGFGYFDWRSFRCTLTYGNWAVNRFPWNPSHAYPHYGFLDGNFRFTINWIW